MRSFRLVCALLTAALVLPAVSVAQDMDNRLTVDRYLDWEDVGNAQLSPDGRQIVYQREWIDAVNDREESSIWIMDADGNRNRFLVDGSSPTWSPDGTRIAYVATGEPSGRQIFVRWMDAEGAVSQITRMSEGPSNLHWSPDGTRIGFQMLVPSPNGASTCRRSPGAGTGPHPPGSRIGSGTGQTAGDGCPVGSPTCSWSPPTWPPVTSPS